MNKVRTVSESKRDFYTYHTRPINTVFRPVIEEILVEMHLLSVNPDFKIDPIYCLGVVSAFDGFMKAYQPEDDKDAIFASLCKSVGGEPSAYRSSADSIRSLTLRISSMEGLVAWLEAPKGENPAEENLAEAVKGITQNPRFKYSRLFAVGLYTLITQIETDSTGYAEVLEKIAATLNLPGDRFKKDLDLYRSNLEKMNQLLLALQDTLEAQRKQREKKSS